MEMLIESAKTIDECTPHRLDEYGITITSISVDDNEECAELEGCIVYSVTLYKVDGLYTTVDIEYSPSFLDGDHWNRYIQIVAELHSNVMDNQDTDECTVNVCLRYAYENITTIHSDYYFNNMRSIIPDSKCYILDRARNRLYLYTGTDDKCYEIVHGISREYRPDSFEDMVVIKCISHTTK